MVAHHNVETRTLADFALQVFLYQFLWFGLWGIVLYLCKGNPKYNEDTKNRAISIIHGLASLFISLIDLFWFHSHIEDKNSRFENSAIVMSVSYFIYDTIGCWLVNLDDRDLYIHHSATVFGLLSSLVSQKGGHFVYFGFLMAEISNFPMHVRKILSNMGLRYTRLFEYSETLYFILYCFARGVLGPIAVFKGVTHLQHVPITLVLVCIMLLYQSFGFIKTMIKMVKAKISHSEERRQKGVEFWWVTVNPRVDQLEYVKTYKQEKLF
jgi:hypothetical protein